VDGDVGDHRRAGKQGQLDDLRVVADLADLRRDLPADLDLGPEPGHRLELGVRQDQVHAQVHGVRLEQLHATLGDQRAGEHRVAGEVAGEVPAVRYQPLD